MSYPGDEVLRRCLMLCSYSLMVGVGGGDVTPSRLMEDHYDSGSERRRAYLGRPLGGGITVQDEIGDIEYGDLVV